MKNSDSKFWPYKPKASIITSFILAVVLLITVGILRSAIGWPSDASTNTVLIGILVLSLLPVLLTVLDVISTKGGSIGYKDFRIDFGKVQQSGFSGFTVPANIGVPGVAVSDSGTPNIIETLKKIPPSGFIIVDLEDGHAWWETRLLVLISGAERLRRPDKIIFVANEEGKQRVFQGWARPEDLLPHLLKENPQYLRSFHAARSAAKQWELVPPLEIISPETYYRQPQQPLPIWIYGSLSTEHLWMPFSTQTGMPNELLTEQYLQHELGEKIESSPGGSKHISVIRLNEMFKPVLIKQSIDMTWTNEKQTNAFLASDSDFIAITENGRYSALVSKLVLFNEALKSIFNNNDK